MLLHCSQTTDLDVRKVLRTLFSPSFFTALAMRFPTNSKGTQMHAHPLLHGEHQRCRIHKRVVLLETQRTLARWPYQAVRDPADAELPEVHDVARQGAGLVAEDVGHLQAGRQASRQRRARFEDQTRGKLNPQLCASGVCFQGNATPPTALTTSISNTTTTTNYNNTGSRSHKERSGQFSRFPLHRHRLSLSPSLSLSLSLSLYIAAMPPAHLQLRRRCHTTEGDPCFAPARGPR